MKRIWINEVSCANKSNFNCCLERNLTSHGFDLNELGAADFNLGIDWNQLSRKREERMVPVLEIKLIQLNLN